MSTDLTRPNTAGHTVQTVWPAVRGAITAIVELLALLLVASAALFVLIRAVPADPVDVQLGPIMQSGLSNDELEEFAAERRAELGLDQPVAVQYVRWLGRMVTGDWGVSFVSRVPVQQELMERLPASATLAITGFAVSIVIAVPTALIASARPGGVADHITRIGILGVAALPMFLLATILISYFARSFGYPVTGPATLGRLWLPALILGLSSAPTFSRVLRSSLISELGRPYAIAATARGASLTRLLTRHVIRPASSPVLTLAGLILASLVTGSIVIEEIFAWPGVASYAVGAINSRDYPVIQAYVLLTVVVVVVVNKATEVVQVIVDPRTAAKVEAIE